MDSIKIRASVIVGSIFCIVADLFQKTDASAVRKLGMSLGEFMETDYYKGKIFAVVLVVLGGVALSYIFEPETKPKAFYLGASVIAIMISVVPYERASAFRTTSNSERVTVTISTEDGTRVSNMEITLWNNKRNKVISRTRFSKGIYTFYQDDGNYQLSLYMPGYKEVTKKISVAEGNPLDLKITLRPSSTPAFIHKILN